MKQPHIIIFNPDQYRADVLEHMGNPAAITPNFDSFARTDGVSFRNTFCQNTVCTPSRCSFMTGWYPHVRGHRTMTHMLHPEHGEPNLLKILKDNGYFVWWGGKNDLSPGQDGPDQYCDIYFQPTKADMDRWGLSPLSDEQVRKERRGEKTGENYYSMYLGKYDKGDNPVYPDRDWQMILGAVDFINSYEGDKPLCIYLPISYPHPAYKVEEPYYSAIDRTKVPARKPEPRDWNQKPVILKGIYDRRNMNNWTEEQWTELRATYYGMCMRVDDQFGRITSALKKNNYYENSAVFAFSDHGDFTGDYGLVEKTQNTFEDSLSNVPFLVKLPGQYTVQPGIRNELVELIDFPATVYDITGIDPGYDHFGKPLTSLLEGKTQAHRDAVFCEGGRLKNEPQAMELINDGPIPEESYYWPRVIQQNSDRTPAHTKATMCRTRNYKYVKRLYEPDELYDLAKDPDEVNNEIDHPAYREILIELKERLLHWYQETCDVTPHQIDGRGFPE